MSEDTILTDKRTIKGLYVTGDAGWLWKRADGLEIEAYGENAPSCLMPWFRVKKDGKVLIRIPASTVCVEYEIEDGAVKE